MSANLRWDMWALIVCVGLITLAFRASFIVFVDPERFPAWFRRALAFVPAAVIAALVAPGLAIRANTTHIDWTNPRLYAGCVALAIAFRFKNALWPIVGGMFALWLLQWGIAKW